MNNFVKFTGNLLFIITLFLLLYAYAMFQGGFVSWFLFFSFLPIFLYQIGLLFYPIQKWHVKRDLSQRIIHAGESITVTIKINRKIPFPLFYCIFEEVVPQSLKKIDNQSDKYYHLNDPNQLVDRRQIKKVTFPWFRNVIELQYDIDQIPRGEHQFDAIKIRLGDVFGFIKREYIYQVKDELIVYPVQRNIKTLDKVTRINEGESTAQMLHVKNSNVVSGIREYVPGDKFSWIDWKQTARNHSMMTKEFEQEKSTDVLVILNECNSKTINPLAFEGAIEVTNALIGNFEKQGSKVSLLSIGRDLVFFQGQDEIVNKEAIRQYLTRVQPNHMNAFSRQLLKGSMNFGRHSFIAIITTYMDTAFYETVQKVNKQTEKVVVLLIQAESRISQVEYEITEQLKIEGMMVGHITEDELTATPIEVNIS